MTRLFTSRTVENRRSGAPQLQFDYGYMVDGGPLQSACFFVGTNTPSGAYTRQWCQTPRRWTCPTWLLEPPYVCVISGTNASVHTETKKEFFSCCWTKLQNNAVLLGQDWKILRQVSPTQSHQSSGSRRRPVSTVRGLASTYLAVITNKISSDDVKPDSANVAVDNQTRRVGSLAQDTTCAETCA